MSKRKNPSRDAKVSGNGTPTRASEQVDRRQMAEAIRKVVAGEKLTAREQAALKRHEKEREEKLRWEHYGSIPQKHWREMSGRQAKVLKEQATLYGIPFGGPTINLPDVVRALHDFLAANARKLSQDDELMSSDVPSPALERYREARAAMARLDLLERKGIIVRRDRIREALARIAAGMRIAAERLTREYGSEIGQELLDILTEAERDIEQYFADHPKLDDKYLSPDYDPSADE
jgi:hypothetical protein